MSLILVDDVSLYGAITLVSELGAVLGREGEETEGGRGLGVSIARRRRGFKRSFTLCTVSQSAL